MMNLKKNCSYLFLRFITEMYSILENKSSKVRVKSYLISPEAVMPFNTCMSDQVRFLFFAWGAVCSSWANLGT